MQSFGFAGDWSLMAMICPDFKAESSAAVPAVFIDFDGTVCHDDVTDVLLRKFASSQWELLEEEWIAGKIGARACMAGQISLLRATPDEVNACLDEVQIDAAFASFIEMLRSKGIKAAIVSDGLDYSIRHILLRHGVADIPVFSNCLVYNGDRTWRLEFPYKSMACPAGHCKCRRFDSLPPGFTL